MLEYNGQGEPEYIGAAACGKRSGMGRLLGKKLRNVSPRGFSAKVSWCSRSRCWCRRWRS